MYKTLLLLAAIGLAQARPNDPSSINIGDRSFHPDCTFQQHHLLAHEYDCSKYYYCEFGLRWNVPRNCAPGTHFSAVKQVCDHIALVGCTLSGSAESINVPSSGCNPVTTTQGTGGCPPGPVTTEKPDLGELLPNGCPANFSIHHLLPHETYCNKFYYCVFGDLVERLCAPGTHFNFEEQVCDWPHVVGCEGDIYVPDPSPCDPTTTTPGGCPPVIPTTSAPGPCDPVTCPPPTVVPTTTTAPIPGPCDPTTTTVSGGCPPGPGPTEKPDLGELLPNGCPANFSIHHLLPHETYCNKFYYCVFGELVERLCAPGTHFNFEEQVCDWPHVVGCEGDIYVPDPNPCDPTTTTPGGCPPVIPTTLAPGPCDPVTCPPPIVVPTTTPAATPAPCDPVTCPPPVVVPTTTTAPAPGPCDPTTTTPGGGCPPGPGPTEKPDLGELLPNGCPANFSIHHLLPHETYCNKFYYCVFGKLVERLCAPGTHFNFEEQVCDWPHVVGCEGDIYVPDPNPCDPTTTTPGGCPPVIPTTLAPGPCDPVTCPPPIVVPTTTLAPVPGPCDPTTTTPGGGCPPGPGPTEKPDLGELLPNGCPANFSIHHLLPHETYCNKFYYCVFGELVERLCAPGTHFNFEEQVCDWPHVVGCEGDIYVPDPNPCDPTTTTPGGCPPVIPTTLAPGPCDPVTCPPPIVIPTTTPAATPAPCDPVTCPPPVIVPTTTTAPAPGPCDPTTTTPGGGCPPGPGPTEKPDLGELLPNGCPANFSIHHLLPHETYCNKFYYCDFGELVERLCAPGTHFNFEEQVCDWPHVVGCEGDIYVPDPNPCDPTTTTPGGCPPVIPTTLAPGPCDPVTCPPPIVVPTTTLAPAPGPCDPTTTTPGGGCPPGPGPTEKPDLGELLPNGCPANFSIHHLLPHETYCNKFYYCVFGKLVERLCAPGTHFNFEEQVCDWPHVVGCEGDIYVPDPNPCDPTTTTPGGCPPVIPTTLAPGPCDPVTCPPPIVVPTTTTAPAPGPCDPTTTTPGGGCPPGPGPTEKPDLGELLPNGCPANFSIHHLLPHETYCNKFYYCVFGDLVERLCAPGTHFNFEEQVCDWPHVVGCEGDIYVPDPNPCDPTTTTPGGCPPVIPTTLAPGPCDPVTCPPPIVVPTTTPAATPAPCDPVTCPPPVVVPTTTTAPAPGPCDPTTTTPGGGCPPGPGPTEKPDLGELLPNGCPANFSIHHLLPHETYCNKFYYCVFGELVERLCAPGTHFNFEEQVCDWPHVVGCEGDIYVPDPSPCDPTTTTPGGCPPVIPTTLAPGPCDPVTCPPPIVVPTTTTAPAPGPCDPTTTTPGGGCPPGPGPTEKPDLGELLPNGCPANFSIHHLLPHETYCNKFYYCVFGELVERVCAPGTHFNFEEQVCDWPRNVDCDGDVYIPSTTLSPCPYGSCPNPPTDRCRDQCNSTPWAHESDCDKYWVCNGNQPVLVTCSEGLHFNIITNTCDYASNCGCVRNAMQEVKFVDRIDIFRQWEEQRY